jgi:hypothetical protein
VKISGAFFYDEYSSERIMPRPYAELLNRIVAAQVSDTTDDAKRTIGG